MSLGGVLPHRPRSCSQLSCHKAPRSAENIWLQYQEIAERDGRGPLRLRQLSADHLGFVGGLLPIALDETLSVETQLRHLLAQRPARNVELFHHGGNLASAFRERTLDHGPLESFDLFGERKLRFLGLRAWR